MESGTQTYNCGFTSLVRESRNKVNPTRRDVSLVFAILIPITSAMELLFASTRSRSYLPGKLGSTVSTIYHPVTAVPIRGRGSHTC
jgi:hypothetical protein